MSDGPKKVTVRILRSILCEEVRAELDNKNTLVGVFSGNIAVQHFPAQIRLAVYSDVEAFASGQHKFKATVSFDGKDIIQGEGIFELPVLGLGALVMPSFIIPVANAGRLTINIAFDEMEPVEIVSREIAVGTIPSLGAAITPT
jgi:hypothetical protein